MKIFDTHAHYDWKEFDADRNKVFNEFNDENIYAVNIGINIESINNVIKYSRENKNLYFSMGIHPMEVENNIDFSKIIKLAKENEKNGKFVAIRRNRA